MCNPRGRQFRMWVDAVDAVSQSNSFTDDQVINTWPDDVKRHYPELTVGAVRYADHCVNNHERLVEALRVCAIQLDDDRPTSRCMDNIASDSAWKLLAELEAGKGGE